MLYQLEVVNISIKTEEEKRKAHFDRAIKSNTMCLFHTTEEITLLLGWKVSLEIELGYLLDNRSFSDMSRILSLCQENRKLKIYTFTIFLNKWVKLSNKKLYT